MHSTRVTRECLSDPLLTETVSLSHVLVSLPMLIVGRSIRDGLPSLARHSLCHCAIAGPTST